MRMTELNAMGDFSRWHPESLAQLTVLDFDEKLGTSLLYEDSRCRLWEISLKPEERLHFRKFKNDFLWYTPTGGIVLSRNIRGNVDLIDFNPGDIGSASMSGDFAVMDLVNLGDQTFVFRILEGVKR